MAQYVEIDVYLINRVPNIPPQDGSTIFAFDVTGKLPDGVAVDRGGNITLSKAAPEVLTIKFALKTPELSWGETNYKVTFQPASGQVAEHMLWIVDGIDKPKKPSTISGFKDYAPTINGNQELMSVTMDRTQANLERYSYGLAVNLLGTESKVITVRDDPQIKNPPREFQFDWVYGGFVGIIAGLLFATLNAWLGYRKARAEHRT